MKASIIMIFDGEEYVYGTYPFNTNAEKDKVNELAMQIRDERNCGTYVLEVNE